MSDPLLQCEEEFEFVPYVLEGCSVMEKAFDNWMGRDILSEVCHMLLTEYDEKKHMKHIYNEGYDEGCESGQVETAQRMDSLILCLEKDGRIEDIAKAARDSEYKEELFREYNL